MFLEILQNLQENTGSRAFLLFKDPGLSDRPQRDSDVFRLRYFQKQMFSSEFCEFSKSTFSYRTPPVAASWLYCIVLFHTKVCFMVYRYISEIQIFRMLNFELFWRIFWNFLHVYDEQSFMQQKGEEKLTWYILYLPQMECGIFINYY